MGKTIVYFALFGILGFGVYFFFLGDSNNLYKEKDANFTIRDTAIVGKIFLVENDGNSILLERKENDEWLVNKQFPAMKMQIKNLLTCLNLQTVFKPVSANEFDRVVKLLAGLSTKVEVFDRKGSKIRSFYVAGQGPNYHGSYMIINGAKNPYLVDIPGFDGYLTPRYTTELNDWKSRTIFDYKSSEIASIAIDYVGTPSSSFIIDNSTKVPTFSNVTILDPAKVNMRRVLSYLDFFTLVNAEGHMNGIVGMDSIINTSKMHCKMTVTLKRGQKTELDIYQITNPDDSDADLLPEGAPKEVERMYCVNLTNKDTLLIQTGIGRTFQKLLQPASVFIQQ